MLREDDTAGGGGGGGGGMERDEREDVRVRDLCPGGIVSSCSGFAQAGLPAKCSRGGEHDIFFIFVSNELFVLNASAPKISLE